MFECGNFYRQLEDNDNMLKYHLMCLDNVDKNNDIFHWTLQNIEES